MLVSVAIPAYNQADYLREAIESVVAQTYHPLEIVVVDDGSTDHTKDVCLSFGDKIKYIYQENDGTQGGGARKRAMLESSGEWIALLDQDDRWLPTKIEKQVELIRSGLDTGIIFTRYVPVDSRGVPLKSPWPAGPSGQVYHKLLELNHYCPSSALIKREVIKVCGLPDGSDGPADYDLFLRIARHFSVAVVDEVLTEYRVHGQNYSADTLRLARGVLKLLHSQKRHLHPGCGECRRALRAGIGRYSRIVALENLEMYHKAARKGDIRQAIPQLLKSIQVSPSTVFQPLRIAAVFKNAIFSMGAKVFSQDSAP